MRGGFLHNQVLIDPIDAEFRRRGARTQREMATGKGRSTGYIDLFVELRGHRIAIEAERSPRRVPGDLAKAAALHVDELWIVVPDVVIARSIRRRLLSLNVTPDQGGLFVLTLGLALRRISECFPLNCESNVP